MIILICAEERKLKNQFSNYFGQSGYSVIQYQNPLKMMDNLEEICPSVVICNALDYPRHWKIIVKQLRDRWSRDLTVIVLSVGDDFDSEEAHKAAFLGVNALYSDNLSDKSKYPLLRTKISRYISLGNVESSSWIPGENERINFIFKHPNEFRIICGHFTKISPSGGDFRPDDPGDSSDMETGDLIENASMRRTSGKIFSVNARIIKNNGNISIAFIDSDSNGFKNFIDEMNLRLISG